MTERNTDAIFVHLEHIKEGIDGINRRLDEQNGRLRSAEQNVAVLQDRADDAKVAGRNWGLSAGSVGAAVGAALAYFFGTAK
jgi:hypothetical protein